MNASSEVAKAEVEASVKDAVAGAIDANAPVKHATDVLESKLGEVVARYDQILDDLVHRYSEVLNTYVSQAEPIESKLNRVRTATFSGDQVIAILSSYEQASGMTPRLTPLQIMDLFDPYMAKPQPLPVEPEPEETPKPQARSRRRK